MTEAESDLINESNKVSGPWGLAAFAVGRWGTLTFGLVAVLLLNEFISKPQLQSANETVKALQDVVNTLREISEADRQTSMRDAETAASLRLTSEIFTRYLSKQGTTTNDN